MKVNCTYESANLKDLQVLQYAPDMAAILSGERWYVPLIEIHPTDYCNLHCDYCTFKNSQRRDVLPIDVVQTICKLKPKVIVISGGGEPTLYRCNKYTLNNLILLLKEKIPDVKIGLKTNGQLALKGKSLEVLEKIRISINAGTSGTLDRVCGGDFEKCLESFVYYLDQNVKEVSIGYLFNDDNVKEIPLFLRRLREIQVSIGEKFNRCVNIQFRPTCKLLSCRCHSDNFRDYPIMVSDTTSEWKSCIEMIKNDLFTDPELVSILECTNLSKKELFDYSANYASFENCYLSLVQMYVRANGNIFPCCQMASSESGSFGNILRDSIEDIRNCQKTFWLSSNSCKDPDYCCQLVSRKNVLLESSLLDLEKQWDNIPYSVFI